MKGLMVSQDPGNADTPRAHITNMAALGRFCLLNINIPNMYFLTDLRLLARHWARQRMLCRRHRRGVHAAHAMVE
jgi:hypothetical protein